jgi:phage tail protein X
LINKKNKLLKKSAYVEMDGFVFTGFPDASSGLPDTSSGLPDTSSVEFPDASVEPENMLPILPNTPPDVFPDGSVVVFPDGSEENGDERLNASLFDENNVLIGVDPFKNDFIVILFQ